MIASDEELRFEFGANWADFLSTIDDERIDEAMRSLRSVLGDDAIAGRTWLDIGSGSGLFSLAAARLGASQLHSFDYDPSSVGCTLTLREREQVDPDRWSVEQGSALDRDYLASLGTFDIVYSWGVLHHTGDLWSAFDNAVTAVKPGGVLWVAIYNDQGTQSRIWRRIKQVYNWLPRWARLPYMIAVMGPRELHSLAVHVARGMPLAYLRNWTHYKSTRGMSRWHDLIDWVGGYPFEVAAPDVVFNHAKAHGLHLEHLRTANGLGCSEYVFRRPA